MLAALIYLTESSYHPALRENLPNYPPPAMLVGKLAVDDRFKVEARESGYYVMPSRMH